MAVVTNLIAGRDDGKKKEPEKTTTPADYIGAGVNAVKTAAGVVDKAIQDNRPTSGGGGGGGGTTAKKSTSAEWDYTLPDSVFGDTVNPELMQRYQDAMGALEQMKGKAPTYGSQYDAQIKSLYEEIMGRGPFKYDQKTDPLYQQYVQDYTTQGQRAMRDTMGRAAALTGGYGSSYAQAVGQQQYDQYLQQLGDILPETYGMALNAYNAEGDQLNAKMSTTQSLEQSDYGRYLDALQQHNIDVDRARTDADTAYDRMVADEQKTYSRQLDQYDLQKDYYNRLISLINIGYKPTAEDYARAGISEAQGKQIRKQYLQLHPTSSGGSSSSDLNPVAYRAYQEKLKNKGGNVDYGAEYDRRFG